ncbi:MAG: hypothetical protein JWO76_2279 [Nocardioides sp.]|nr:hypothetical protein [Nocardioides sp.]
MSAVRDNRPRSRVGTDQVESWFVRVNDPDAPRAVWVRATVLTRANGTSVAEAWCSLFDGRRTAALRHQVPLDEASFDSGGPGLDIGVGPLAMHLAEDRVSVRGELGRDAGRVAWDLTLERGPGATGAPMSLLPSARLVDAPFPKNKLLTPFPVGAAAGSLTWGTEAWDLGGWVGMQGHNWGSAHSPEYAWGQCVFPGADAVVEAASGRIELGTRTSPLFSMLVVRRGDEEHRFDRIVDLWRQRPVLDFPRWELTMRGAAGAARLEMTADPAAMVCLGYDNPARARSYCLNSKTARVRLSVAPRHGAPFELLSEHGGALEFLRPDQVPEVQPVV